jgi:hypothetical protein
LSLIFFYPAIPFFLTSLIYGSAKIFGNPPLFMISSSLLLLETEEFDNVLPRGESNFKEPFDADRENMFGATSILFF